MILLTLVPVFYWLAVETDWLRVNLNQPKRELTLFDTTIAKLLDAFKTMNGDIELWDRYLSLNYEMVLNERIARESPFHGGIRNKLPGLSYNELVEIESAYASLVPATDDPGEWGSADVELYNPVYATCQSSGDYRWYKNMRRW